MIKRIPSSFSRIFISLGILFASIIAPFGISAPRAAANPDCNLVFTAGHTDIFYPVMRSGSLRLLLKEDITGGSVVRSPGEVVLGVIESSKTSKTNRVSFIGTETYTLPLRQQSDLLWPGWETTQLSNLSPKSIDMNFVSVDGPGTIYLYTSTVEKGIQPITTANGKVTGGAKYTQHTPGHVHAMWSFTQPGNYYMTVNVTVKTAKGSYTSNNATYHWVVGENALANIKSTCKGAPSKPDNNTSKDSNSNNSNSGSSSSNNSTSGSSSNNNSSTNTNNKKATPSKAPSQAPSTAPSNAPKTKVNDILNAKDCTKETLKLQVPKPEKTAIYKTKVGGQYTIAHNTHVHPNWVFTAPGYYKVQITQTIKIKTGKILSTPLTLNFLVGKELADQAAKYKDNFIATEGHFDVGPIVTDNALIPAVKDDRKQPASWVHPQSLVFVLGEKSKLAAPEGMNFIAAKGKPIWMIQNVQTPGVPWIGANTMHESTIKQSDGGVTWRLDKVTGPGALAVFISGNFDVVVDKIWFGGGEPDSSVAKLSDQQIASYLGIEKTGDKYFVSLTTLLNPGSKNPCLAIKSTYNVKKPQTSSPNYPIIIGGIAGGVAIVAAAGVGTFYYRKQKSQA